MSALKLPARLRRGGSVRIVRQTSVSALGGLRVASYVPVEGLATGGARSATPATAPRLVTGTHKNRDDA